MYAKPLEAEVYNSMCPFQADSILIFGLLGALRHQEDIVQCLATPYPASPSIVTAGPDSEGMGSLGHTPTFHDMFQGACVSDAIPCTVTNYVCTSLQ